MRSRRIAACLILASCLVSPCFAADDEQTDAGSTTLEPLTRGRAAQILSNTDTLAEDLARQIKSLRSSYEADVVDDIRDVLSHSSEWRWYSRDHGILLAIPVKERLGLLNSYKGEKVLADVVRRLINQKGWGNPPVQVVLVEPQLPPPPVRFGVGQPTCCSPASAAGASSSCGCQ
jgi:hypothetical protein